MQQFKRIKNAPSHQFVVFSVIDDDNKAIPKFAQCNNCGVIHKVIDVGKSEIMVGKEHMSSIVSISDMRMALPEKLVGLLEANSCDLPTWESVSFIIEHKRWGDIVVLASDSEAGLRQGKFVKIIGESLFKVESFAREEIVGS
jgi:hypothetical protein